LAGATAATRSLRCGMLASSGRSAVNIARAPSGGDQSGEQLNGLLGRQWLRPRPAEDQTGAVPMVSLKMVMDRSLHMGFKPAHWSPTADPNPSQMAPSAPKVKGLRRP
jgi:hypothetical protein